MNSVDGKFIRFLSFILMFVTFIDVGYCSKSEKERAVVNATVKIEKVKPEDFKSEEQYLEAKKNVIDEAYAEARTKLYKRALKSAMRGENYSSIRRLFNKLGVEDTICEYSEDNEDNLSTYFINYKEMRNKQVNSKLKIKAEIIVDMAAIEDLINDESSDIADDIADMGLIVLFVARVSDEQTDYGDKVEKSSTSMNSTDEDDDSESLTEKSVTKARRIHKQSQFTTQRMDASAVVTNMSAELLEAGVHISNVRGLIPRAKDSEKLRTAIDELEVRYMGYTDDDGAFNSGETEEMIAYIQNEVMSMEGHPRFFALGKLDIGNTFIDSNSGGNKTISKCTMTLWDLDKGFMPKQIAATRWIDGVAVHQDIKESRDKSAENAALQAGEQIVKKMKLAVIDE